MADLDPITALPPEVRALVDRADFVRGLTVGTTADVIEALRAALLVAYRERDEWRALAGANCGARAAAERDVARLREALDGVWRAIAGGHLLLAQTEIETALAASRESQPEGGT